MRPYSKSPQQGFTLVELLITSVLVGMLMYVSGIAAIDQLRAYMVKNSASQMSMVGDAVKAFLALPANQPTLEASATTTLTVAQLQLANSCGTNPCLTSSISDTNSWGAGYNITIRRIGTASPYLYEFLVVTTTPYVVDGVARLDILSRATNSVGEQLGFTTDDGGVLRAKSPGAGWTALATDYPIITAGSTANAGGQMAYFWSQAGLPYDSVYLRVNGGNQMTGNLNLGANGIYNMSKGLNAAGVNSAAANGNNDVIVSGALQVAGNANVAGSSTLSGNTTVGGSLGVTGNTQLAGNLTMNGAAANLSLTGANAKVQLSGTSSDIEMASLQTTAVSGGTAMTTTSVTKLLPKLVEVASYNVGNGSVVAAPSCVGGTPSIFVMPSTATTTVTNGTNGYLFSASGSGPWTVIAWDIATPGTCGGSNGVPANSATCLSNPNGAIARVFCQY